MAPGEVPEGVQIERFEVESFGDLDWIVRVTLIHVAERHRVVAGDVELVLIDSADGSEIQLSAANEGENLIARNYRFRYFQTIEQPVTLPENVQPKAVKVTVRGKKGRDSRNRIRLAGVLMQNSKVRFTNELHGLWI